MWLTSKLAEPELRRLGAPAPIHWALLAFLVLLSGCSIVPQYPSNLPKLAKAEPALEVCPSIEGSFFDTGQATAPDGRIIGSVSLTRLLHPQAEELENADFVVVRGPEHDVVEIVSFQGQTRLALWRQAKVSKESYLAKGDRVAGETYLCQDGFVRLGRAYSVGGSGAPGLVVLAIKHDFLWLRKATDGSLIALHTFGEGVLLNFIVPVGHGDKVWYQFLPASVPAITQPNGSLQGTPENAARS